MNSIIIENNHETRALSIHNEPVKLSGYYYNSKNKRENNIYYIHVGV